LALATYCVAARSWSLSIEADISSSAELDDLVEDDPFETSGRLAFFGSFVNIVRMTVVVITFANLWWRST
jgi:hypothetical protein